MQALFLTIHILIALALVFVILLQRSEGGGLGIGGSGGGQGGGFMTARGTANLLTRVTTFLAIGFFATSITLAILSGRTSVTSSILDEVVQETETSTSTPLIPALPADQ
ncbi:MAG: preprotein translocase subunit SecG [Alphaproteobacteria bacterium]|nr:preprotein translocase subunit SecG [Alphaproteobacteria bacterium]